MFISIIRTIVLSTGVENDKIILFRKYILFLYRVYKKYVHNKTRIEYNEFLPIIMLKSLLIYKYTQLVCGQIYCV